MNAEQFPAVLKDRLAVAGGELYRDGDGRLRARPLSPPLGPPRHPVGLGVAEYPPSKSVRYEFDTDDDLRAVMAACDHPAALARGPLSERAAAVRAALDALLGEKT